MCVCHDQDQKSMDGHEGAGVRGGGDSEERARKSCGHKETVNDAQYVNGPRQKKKKLSCLPLA